MRNFKCANKPNQFFIFTNIVIFFKTKILLKTRCNDFCLGDQECLISTGPITVSIPYPIAYPEYFGLINHVSNVSKILFPMLAKLAIILK